MKIIRLLQKTYRKITVLRNEQKLICCLVCLNIAEKSFIEKGYCEGVWRLDVFMMEKQRFQLSHTRHFEARQPFAPTSVLKPTPLLLANASKCTCSSRGLIAPSKAQLEVLENDRLQEINPHRIFEPLFE